MKQFWIICLFGIAICQAAPQDTGAADAAAAEGGSGDEGGDANAAADLTEVIDLMAWLKMNIKMPLEMIVQDKLFQPKKILKQTVQEVMNDVLELRKTVLQRIKDIRSKTVMTNPALNIKQEEYLNELRMDIMGVLLMLVEKDADNLESLQAVGKELLSIRMKIVAKNMQLIMLREGGRISSQEGDCDCAPLDELEETLDTDKVKEAGGGEEALDGAKVLEHLNMQLMSVDSAVEVKYMDILQEDDEEKRKELEDGLFDLKEVSNCLNDVMLEVSATMKDGETDSNKLKRVIERNLNQCTSMVKRQLKQCKENCPTGAGPCDSCGADLIDEIVNKLKDWELIMSEGDEADEGKRDDVRDEALTFLNTLDSMMTKLLNNKISNTTEGEEERKCEKEKLEVISNSKNPMWMLVNVTIFGEDALVQEMIAALIEAKTDMRKEYCKEEETDNRQPVESCDIDEIAIAKSWTGTIDDLITTQIFVEDPKPVEVMLEIVKIKGTMEERVRELFKDGLKCNEEVEQIKNIYNDQISKCLQEMMDPTYDFAALERHKRVDCMKQLRNKIEERRGMLWMRELMKKISESGSESSGDDYDGN